jgi:hypothetical protein
VDQNQRLRTQLSAPARTIGAPISKRELELKQKQEARRQSDTAIAAESRREQEERDRAAEEERERERVAEELANLDDTVVVANEEQGSPPQTNPTTLRASYGLRSRKT